MKYIDIDLRLKEFFLLILPALFLFPHGFYLLICVGSFYFLFLLLQQKNKPGVFTFILAQHLLQIIAGVILCIYIGADINFRSPNISTAIIASITGLNFLFIPIIYFQNRIPPVTASTLAFFANKLSTGKVLRCYIISFFITSFLSIIAFGYPGLTQIIVSFVKIKWFFFLLFGFLSLIKKEKRRAFYLFVLFEFCSGFFSYFSDFKTVIYFLIILILSITERITVRRFLQVCLISTILVAFAIFWTGIKTEYRAFLNGGRNSQTIQVSRAEALDKLYGLSSKVETEVTNSRVYQLLDRIQYTYFFALTIDRVPSVLPHTNGKTWTDNIMFATTPRFLNPNKPVYEATERTKKYTGKLFAGLRQGTSFSLGYFVECFIDFGLEGMVFPLLLIGLMYGLTYFYLVKKSSKNLIFNYAVVGAFFMEFYPFEMDGMYLLGRFLSSLVTFLLLIHFVFPYLMNYISLEKNPRFAFDLPSR